MNHSIRNILFISLSLILVFSCASSPKTAPTRLVLAEISDVSQVEVKFTGLPQDISGWNFTISNGITITSLERQRNTVTLEVDQVFSIQDQYTIQVSNADASFTAEQALRAEKLEDFIFNAMYSEKPMGMNLEDGDFVFRLFVPRGKKVELHIFENHDSEVARVIPMENDGNQVFEARVSETLWGLYYGYRISERNYDPEPILPNLPMDTVFADPYSKALATSNSYPQKGRTLIYDDSNFNWEGDQPIGLDIRDAVIMEAHLKDLTGHESSGSSAPGTYLGMLDANPGGIAWLKSIGVNAVEFLPLQDFCNVEPPFGKTTLGYTNDFNGYAQNYWGYMTTNFFAPESYYASDGNLDPASWNGTDGRAVTELKTLIKELHNNGIAVLMDVVYNHVSEFDENALKLIDYDFYFKDSDGTGTGNEVESRRKMARRLILDSVRYWMEEYHVDGFRFDLAASHDPETIQAIYDMAKSINPDVLLIAEPWGGEGATSADQFLNMGWSKWNSEIRDAIRSQNRPTTEGDVFVLGDTDGAKNLIPWWADISTAEPFQYVHYIESHDDTALGDNLRVQSGFYSYKDENGEINRIQDIEAYLSLTPDLLDAHRIAAAGLLFSQGPVMLHLGQEWARGKITPDLSGEYPEVTSNGTIGSSSNNIVYLTPDPNSYNADNDTNFINYDYAQLNLALTQYYQGLIALRLSEPLLGRATQEILTALESENQKAIGVDIDGELYAFLNASREEAAVFIIPEGSYAVLVDKTRAGVVELSEIPGGEISLEPASVLFLKRK
jgi:pullulanase/glycogen debranching enzyme